MAICSKCAKIIAYRGNWEEFTGAAPCVECKNYLIYEAGWHSLANHSVISPSWEALSEFREEHQEELEKWEKTGKGSSFSIYLADMNDREYERLVCQEIERCGKKGVFIY